MSLELLSTIIGCIIMCKCSDPGGVDFDSILLHVRLHIIPLGVAESIWGQGGGGMVGVVGLLTVAEGGSKKQRVSRIYNRGWHLCFP